MKDVRRELMEKYAIIMEPVFYDCYKLPSCTYQEADRHLSYCTPEAIANISKEDMERIEKQFKRRDIITKEVIEKDTTSVTHMDLTEEYQSKIINPKRKNPKKRRIHRIHRLGDIIEIISHDSDCILWCYGLPIPLGKGNIYLPHCMFPLPDLWIEYDFEAIIADLIPPLELKYYNIDDTLKKAIPSHVNVQIKDYNYDINYGAIRRSDKPQSIILIGNDREEDTEQDIIASVNQQLIKVEENVQLLIEAGLLYVELATE